MAPGSGPGQGTETSRIMQRGMREKVKKSLSSDTSGLSHTVIPVCLCTVTGLSRLSPGGKAGNDGAGGHAGLLRCWEDWELEMLLVSTWCGGAAPADSAVPLAGVPPQKRTFVRQEIHTRVLAVALFIRAKFGSNLNTRLWTDG